MAIIKFLFVLLMPMTVLAQGFEFQNKVVFPGETKFENTLFGGISGLAFDEKSQTLFALSDDRGEHGEPRLFEFSTTVVDGKLVLKFSKIVYLKAPQKRVDYEAIALLPSGNLLVSSEGDQNFKPRIAPEILEFSRDGKFIRNWDIPTDWIPDAAGKLKSGVRNNNGLEALALSPNKDLLFVAPEDTLVQHNQKIHGRMYNNGKPNVVCELELNPANKGFAHGISEAIWKTDQELWVLERSIRSDLSGVAEIYQIPIGADGSCGPKKLLADLAKNSSKLSNFEGMTWGPTIKSGFRSLIVVSDNNFVLNLPTEFYLFLISE